MRPGVRRCLFAGTILALIVISFGCASTSRDPATRISQGELSYVSQFCEAHAMVGLVDAVDRQLSMRLTEFERLSINTSKMRSVVLQQRLLGYSSRWQHLHQSMTTACRDLAICRYRTASAASRECDALRDRSERVTSEGQSFLMTLGEIDLHRLADSSACPDCPR